MYGYGYHVDLDLPFDQAVDQVAEALKRERFGVLFRIDMQAMIKEKLGVDTPGYVILGACNPQLSYRAMRVEPDIGLLLPCNVVVRENGDRVTAAFIDPQTIAALTGGSEVRAVADDASERLERVRDSLRAGAGGAR